MRSSTQSILASLSLRKSDTSEVVMLLNVWRIYDALDGPRWKFWLFLLWPWLFLLYLLRLVKTKSVQSAFTDFQWTRIRYTSLYLCSVLYTVHTSWTLSQYLSYYISVENFNMVPNCNPPPNLLTISNRSVKTVLIISHSWHKVHCSARAWVLTHSLFRLVLEYFSGVVPLGGVGGGTLAKLFSSFDLWNTTVIIIRHLRVNGKKIQEGTSEINSPYREKGGSAAK